MGRDLPKAFGLRLGACLEGNKAPAIPAAKPDSGSGMSQEFLSERLAELFSVRPYRQIALPNRLQATSVAKSVRDPRGRGHDAVDHRHVTLRFGATDKDVGEIGQYQRQRRHHLDV